MATESIVRTCVPVGSGEEPTTATAPGGYSPSFVNSLTSKQIDAVALLVHSHVWEGSCSEVDHVATWSPDLASIEELRVTCSCGLSVTFDPAGREVIAHG